MAQTREERNLKTKLWREKNKDHVKQYCENNRPNHKETCRIWRINNRKKVLEYKKNNKERSRFFSAKRKADKLKRTPFWLNKKELKAIRSFYKNCPKGYEVDHIIPLKGKLISGLHVLSNLQYLTKEENHRKLNKYNLQEGSASLSFDSTKSKILEEILDMTSKNIAKYNCNVKTQNKENNLFKKNVEDAGIDLSVNTVEDKGSYLIIGTGTFLQPEAGLYFMLVARSSAFKKGLMLYNNIGIIDENYTGEVKAIFYKTDDYKEPPVKGERLMQLIPQKRIDIEFIEVAELSETTRGTGGFGSTDQKVTDTFKGN